MKTTKSHTASFPSTRKMIIYMLLVCALGFLSCLVVQAQPEEKNDNNDSPLEGLAYRDSEKTVASNAIKFNYLLPSINSIYVKALPIEFYPVEVAERQIELESWMMPAGRSGWNVETSLKLPDFLIEVADEELRLESWMMDFKTSTKTISLEFLEEIEEEELNLEDWMLDPAFWKSFCEKN